MYNKILSSCQISSFATTQIKPVIILSEINQTERNKSSIISLVCKQVDYIEMKSRKSQVEEVVQWVKTLACKTLDLSSIFRTTRWLAFPGQYGRFSSGDSRISQKFTNQLVWKNCTRAGTNFKKLFSAFYMYTVPHLSVSLCFSLT